MSCGPAEAVFLPCCRVCYNAVVTMVVAQPKSIARERNVFHPAAIQILDTAQDIPAIVPTGLQRRVSESLPEVVARIVAQLDPEKIVLFGSYAYGAPTADSDVDLLIILDTDAPRRERTWLVSRLLIPRPFPVDILVKTPQEIEQALAGRDFFLQEIMRRGKVLYERSK